MLALLLKVTGTSLPVLSLIIAALSDGLSTVGIVILAVRAGTRPTTAMLAAATFALAPKNFFFAQSGMETSFITCATLLCCWLYIEKYELAWGLVAGIALLTRPDAFLIVAVLLIHYIWQQHALPWRAGCVIIVLCAPWLVLQR